MTDQAATQNLRNLEELCRDIIEDAIALGSSVAISTEEYFGRKDALIQRCIAVALSEEAEKEIKRRCRMTIIDEPDAG